MTYIKIISDIICFIGNLVYTTESNNTLITTLIYYISLCVIILKHFLETVYVAENNIVYYQYIFQVLH